MLVLSLRYPRDVLFITNARKVVELAESEKENIEKRKKYVGSLGSLGSLSVECGVWSVGCLSLSVECGVWQLAHFKLKLKQPTLYTQTFLSAQNEIRTRTVSRHPLKVVRLPISPPGHLIQQGLQKYSFFLKSLLFYINRLFSLLEFYFKYLSSQLKNSLCHMILFCGFSTQ